MTFWWCWVLAWCVILMVYSNNHGLHFHFFATDLCQIVANNSCLNAIIRSSCTLLVIRAKFQSKNQSFCCTCAQRKWKNQTGTYLQLLFEPGLCLGWLHIFCIFVIWLFFFCSKIFWHCDLMFGRSIVLTLTWTVFYLFFITCHPHGPLSAFWSSVESKCCKLMLHSIVLWDGANIPVCAYNRLFSFLFFLSSCFELFLLLSFCKLTLNSVHYQWNKTSKHYCLKL